MAALVALFAGCPPPGSPQQQSACPPSGPAVWGFADLHTHPASHLGFGSDKNGNNGLFWGRPADDDGTFDAGGDLPACSTYPFLGTTHNAGAVDFVQAYSDSQIVSSFQGTVNSTNCPFDDQNSGAPSFSSWPAAVSIDHQQMDIGSIQRAYNGGLRLMFASVTDDELISLLWNQKFNPFGNSPPVHDSQYDFGSAITQLSYIQNLVAHTPWMQIVTTPAEARTAITNGKLAVVLSLEMDTLTLPQVQALVECMQVRHVIPIHLVDNADFGGSAIYSQTFYSENLFFNDGGVQQTQWDDSVTFLATTQPSVLASFAPYGAFTEACLAAWPIWGSSVVSLLPEEALCTTLLAQGELGYQPSPDLSTQPVGLPTVPPGETGEINATGLNRPHFLALMQQQCGGCPISLGPSPQPQPGPPCGLLLDVAHMGKNSAQDALELAGQFQYPVMDSHTGIRCDTGCTADGGTCQTDAGQVRCGSNERSLPLEQLQAIRALGGVIGFGVVADEAAPGAPADPDPIGTWFGHFATAAGLMGERGIALGTDTDGLSPLMPADPNWNADGGYPITVAQYVGGNPQAPGLPRMQLGSRTFDFGDAGTATYGMLPDFLQAASQRQPNIGPGTPLWALFHSAEDTIEMWEGAVCAESNIPDGGSNQVATSCQITSQAALDQPAQFGVLVLDQQGQLMQFPVQVTYSGNVPSLPSPRFITGMDSFTTTLTVPNTYSLTASFASVTDFSCSATVILPPILDSATSPLSNALEGTLVNANGTTQLTLSGLGFSTATYVNIGAASVPVTPTSDTTLTVTAPAYSGVPGTVNVDVMAASGVVSNALSVVYFTPDVPFVNASTLPQCGKGGAFGPTQAWNAAFSVDAFVMDDKGNVLQGITLGFSVGGLNQSIQVGPTGEANFTGTLQQLSPAMQASYAGTVTFTRLNLRKPPTTTQQGFTLLPAAPSYDQCHHLPTGELNPNFTGDGPMFDNPPCFECGLVDLPSDFEQTKFYVDDLGTLGAFFPVKKYLLPTLTATRGTFLMGLSRILRPNLSRLVGLPGTGNAMPVSRGEAASLVARFLALPGAPKDAQGDTAALVKMGFLSPVAGAAAPAAPLTRLDMVRLLWHLARLRMTSLARQSK